MLADYFVYFYSPMLGRIVKIFKFLCSIKKVSTFIQIFFNIAFIFVFLLLNNTSPGRVLCDSSGRKRTKLLDKIDIFDIRSAFFG